jgi:hypothetical protein
MVDATVKANKDALSNLWWVGRGRETNNEEGREGKVEKGRKGQQTEKKRKEERREVERRWF